MKIAALLFLTLFLGKGCEEQQQDLSAAVVVYTANTRGFYRQVTIKDKSVFVQKERDQKGVPAAIKISNSDWKELIAAFNEIDLENLPNLKAPTEKRFYDGAAIANLTVTYKNKTYESSSFDHGNPPAEIEKLVTKIVSFVPKNNDN